MQLGVGKVKKRVFDTETQKYIAVYVDDTSANKQVVDGIIKRDIKDLAEYLGFPKSYATVAYDPDDFFFTKHAQDMYEAESLQGVSDVVLKTINSLSIGYLSEDIVFDLGVGVDYLKLAFVMLRYAYERGMDVSPLITAYDCQNMVLNYRGVKDSTGRDMIDNFDTELAIVTVNGGTPVTYLQTFYFERLKRGRRTIFFVQNRDAVRLVLRELCKSQWLPDGAVYVGLQVKRDVNIFDTIKKDVLRYSKAAYEELDFMQDIDIPKQGAMPVSRDSLEQQNLVTFDNNQVDTTFDLLAGTSY